MVCLLSISSSDILSLTLEAMIKDKRCFASLTDVLNTLILEIPFIAKHRQTLLFQFVTLINLFLQPKCFVETNDIVIDPIPEYFNDNISPCDRNACLTCNS